MDLTKDNLYDWTNPDNTPCRWAGNIQYCRNSQFFNAVTMLSLFISASILPTSIILMYQVKMTAHRWMRPWLWNVSTMFYGSCFLSAILFVLYDGVLLLDPPSPYWLRHTLFDLPFTTVLLGVIPFLHALTYRGALAVPNHLPGATPESTPLHRVVQLLPPLLVLSCLGITARAICMDMKEELGSEILTTVGLGAMGLACMGISMVCWICGCRFSATLNTRIATVEDGLQGMRKTASRVYYSNPQASAISGTHSNGISPSVAVPPTLTVVEAKAVLQKATYLNFILGVSTGFSALVGFLMAGLRSDIFSIIPLSKLTFISLAVFVPLEMQVVILCCLYAELTRRRKKREIEIQDSLVAQAMYLQENLGQHAHTPATIHHTTSLNSPTSPTRPAMAFLSP
ncbi:MAG: hypothetical protein DHS80DRAFT_24724 [Piptocephalis tieghemiana]|nr:MAG: hypothetical protein DHS80DRAFT_24724 [Piptocephalis tieghemiana]